MPADATDRRLVVAVLVLIGALFVVPALVRGFGTWGVTPMLGGPGGGMHGAWGGGMHGPGTWSGSVPWWVVLLGVALRLMFAAGLVVLGYLGYRALTDAGEGTDDAMAELRRAYARGDLSDEEYETRRAKLERDP
ncbi:MAG: SHOCT domain-containing protein [Haloarculaceae archaeon]